MTTAAVASAPSSAADVQEIVRAAMARGAPLRIRGAGSWMDAGAPVPSADSLPLDRLSGIVEYVPGDLTLTALAATPLSDIARVTRAERQWLAFDPAGGEYGTLGATVATASNGPLAAGFGTVRDAVLGVEVVTGAGAVVRGGGRVVKNVAGFDLCRLFTGSWGTLGVLTEVTVRLRALPEEERSLAVMVPNGDIGQQLARLRRAPFTPYAAQLVSAPLARCLGAGDGEHAVLALRLGGNSDALAAQARYIGSIGSVSHLPDEFWRSLRAAEPPGATVVRVSRAPAQLPYVWRTAEVLTAAATGALMHACVARGVVRVILPHEPLAEAPSLLRDRAGAPTVILERAPAAWWSAFLAARVTGELSQRVRAAFDPRHLLNRGILGEPA